MITLDQQLQEVTRSIRAARCARAPVIDGAPCGDVKADLVRISLADIPDDASRERLQFIPTTLTLSRPDVDALIDAGHSAVVGSESLRQFLDNYPIRPAEPASRPARASRPVHDARARRGGGAG